MPFSLLPRVIFERLTDIPPDYLKQKQLKLLMLDFDNTILPYTGSEPSHALLNWFAKMHDAGLLLCVVSNSHKQKASNFCARYGLDCITKAKKPFSKGIRACLQQYNLPPDSAALVGDQIFTDILGANCVGVCSVLVRPIHLSNIWLKLRHVAEQPFILLSKKRRFKHGES